MTQNSDGTPVRCPHCGSQQRRSDFVVCWLCEQPLASPPVGVPPFAAMPETIDQVLKSLAQFCVLTSGVNKNLSQLVVNFCRFKLGQFIVPGFGPHCDL